MIYVVMRGRAVLSLHDTEHAATAAAEGPNMRVEVRLGCHERWTCHCHACRDWWRKRADWNVVT